jgi:hypothetical protein
MTDNTENPIGDQFEGETPEDVFDTEDVKHVPVDHDPFEEEDRHKHIVDAMVQFGQTTARVNLAIADAMRELAAGLDNLAHALTAPRKVLRDNRGKIVGTTIQANLKQLN